MSKNKRLPSASMGFYPLLGALIGGLGGVLIGHLIYQGTADKFKGLQATRKARAIEFEGYMMGAGLSGVMEEFKAQ